MLQLVLLAALAAGPAPLPGKKLIETGWDEPTTERFRQNIAEMEKRPFDGVVIGAVGHSDPQHAVSLRGAFVADKWEQAWFQSCVDDLRAVHPTRLTSNFLCLGANPGNVDWFDDAGWQSVAEHWRIAAWIAKQGGLKGILFDPEPYTAPFSQFSYAQQAGRAQHTFAEYHDKARQRGREVMTALAAEFPDCVLYTYFMNVVNHAATNQTDPLPALESSGYGLYAAFIDGWLDAAPPTLTFVDGCEMAYMYNSPLQYLESAVRIKHDCQALVSPENRARYRAQVQVSFGMYLDAYVNPPTSPYYLPDPESTDAKEAPRLRKLRLNLQAALGAADEYVWVYGEKYRWWPTPNGSIDAKSWEEAMPGCEAVLGFARDPLEFGRARVAELTAAGKLVNLTRNGGFEAATPAADGQPARPAEWGFWQADSSKGTASHDAEVGAAAKGSARAAGVSNGCFTQSVDAQPGEHYLVRAKRRQQGHGTSWIRVRWQTADIKWTREVADQLFYPVSAEADWQEMVGVAEVPDGVGKLVILLCAAGAETAEDGVWFDDVELVRLD